MNINQDLAIKSEMWLERDLAAAYENKFTTTSDCLERLALFNQWVSDQESVYDLAGILTGVHNCRQRHLLDLLMPKQFYCSVTAKPDKKFVKELIAMYYDSVTHYMKCL